MTNDYNNIRISGQQHLFYQRFKKNSRTLTIDKVVLISHYVMFDERVTCTCAFNQ